MTSIRRIDDLDASKGVWLVDVKGSREQGLFEISVVRAENRHGQESWGWFDENKILISKNGSSNYILDKFIWDKMIRLAHEIAIELNEKERKVYY